MGAIGRRRRFRLAAEELILELTILAAKLGDFLLQLGDPLLGRSVLAAPIAGLLPEFEVLAPQLRHFGAQLGDLLAQLRQPRRLGGRPIDIPLWTQRKVFHDPGNLRNIDTE